MNLALEVQVNSSNNESCFFGFAVVAITLNEDTFKPCPAGCY